MKYLHIFLFLCITLMTSTAVAKEKYHSDDENAIYYVALAAGYSYLDESFDNAKFPLYCGYLVVNIKKDTITFVQKTKHNIPDVVDFFEQINEKGYVDPYIVAHSYAPLRALKTIRISPSSTKWPFLFTTFTQNGTLSEDQPERVRKHLQPPPWSFMVDLQQQALRFDLTIFARAKKGKDPDKYLPKFTEYATYHHATKTYTGKEVNAGLVGLSFVITKDAEPFWEQWTFF